MQGSTLANRFAYKRHPVGGVGMGAGGEVQAHVLSILAKYFVLGGYWSSGELFGSPSCYQTSWVWAGSRGLFTRQHEIQLLQKVLKVREAIAGILEEMGWQVGFADQCGNWLEEVSLAMIMTWWPTPWTAAWLIPRLIPRFTPWPI